MRTQLNNIWSFIAVAVVCLVNEAATAADFTWLNTPASENWNIVDENWNGAGSVWVNNPENNAVFGMSDTKNITVDAVTAKNLTFNADGYTLVNGTLDLSGNITVGSSQTATVSTPITSTNRLSKLGVGTLVLSPGAEFSNNIAQVSFEAGTLHHASGTTFVTRVGSVSAPSFWVKGGTLVMGGGLIRTTAGTHAVVRDGGTLLITNGTVDVSSNSELLNAYSSSGKTIVSDNGILDTRVLRITQSSEVAANNAVNVNTGGTIRLEYYRIDVNQPYRRGMLNLNGGVSCAKANSDIFLGDGSDAWLKVITANVLEGGAIFDTAGYNIGVWHPLESAVANDGGLTKRGLGALSLRGTNTYNGGTFVYGGTLDLVHDNNLGAVPDAGATNLIFAGTGLGFRAGTNYALHANRTLFITNDTDVSFDTQGYTQTVNSVIAGAAGSTLKKAGTGVLVLDPGAGRTNTVSSLKNQAGTLVLASGAFTVTTNAPGSPSDVFYVSGGTVLVAGASVSTIGAGYMALVNGNLVITNGTLNHLNGRGELLNAYRNRSSTTVSGSGVLNLSRLRISQYTGGTVDSNVVNVDTGGVIRLNNLYIDTQAPFIGGVNFNGGTLVAKSTQDDFMGIFHPNWRNVFFTVRAGGAVIDSNGFDIDNKQPLQSGAENDGGLTKRGDGMFTLATNNTYNGVTSVEAGTLRLGLDNALPPTNTVTVSSNAVFDVNNKVQSLAQIGGSGTMINNGTLSVTETIMPGNDDDAFGTLTLATTPASLAGVFKVNAATNGACGRLHVQGDLDLSGLSLSVVDTEQLDNYKWYNIATCTGALSGTFTTSNLPRLWLIRYKPETGSVYIKYNYGSLIILR